MPGWWARWCRRGAPRGGCAWTSTWVASAGPRCGWCGCATAGHHEGGAAGARRRGAWPGRPQELDAAVAALLGLNAHQFTTCVVLPQGQFARFLQAKPADRQDLLVRLLELGLYDALREAAGQRAARLEGELARLRPRLEALAHATPEAVAVEQERVAVLDAVLVAVEARLPDLARVDRHREASTRALADLDAQRNRLDDVRRPDGLDDLEAQAVKARAAEAAAEDGELEALAALDAARAGSRGLGRAWTAGGLAARVRRAAGDGRSAQGRRGRAGGAGAPAGSAGEGVAAGREGQPSGRGGPRAGGGRESRCRPPAPSGLRGALPGVRSGRGRRAQPRRASGGGRRPAPARRGGAGGGRGRRGQARGRPGRGQGAGAADRRGGGP